MTKKIAMKTIELFDKLSSLVTTITTKCLQTGNYCSIKTFLAMFPNPAHNEVRIYFADSQEFHGEISILNLLGMVTKTFLATSGTTIIPIEDLCSGVYVIKVVHQSRVLTEKLMID